MEYKPEDEYKIKHVSDLLKYTKIDFSNISNLSQIRDLTHEQIISLFYKIDWTKKAQRSQEFLFYTRVSVLEKLKHDGIYINWTLLIFNIVRSGSLPALEEKFLMFKYSFDEYVRPAMSNSPKNPILSDIFNRITLMTDIRILDMVQKLYEEMCEITHEDKNHYIRLLLINTCSSKNYFGYQIRDRYFTLVKHLVENMNVDVDVETIVIFNLVHLDIFSYLLSKIKNFDDFYSKIDINGISDKYRTLIETEIIERHIETYDFEKPIEITL